LEGGSLDDDVNSKCTSGICLDMKSLCSDPKLASDAACSKENAPCVLPVGMKFDHLSLQLKKIDVARIKCLLVRRKSLIEIHKQNISSDDLCEEAWIERELESRIVINQEADHTVTSDDLRGRAEIEKESESGIVIGQINDQAFSLDGLTEEEWIVRELESGIIVGPGPAAKKQKA
jgi:cyclin T